MFTEYVNVSHPDEYERASKFLLMPANAAFGTQIDVLTGLVLPPHHIIIRIAAAAAALLLLPVTVMGLALQSMSATHWQHADSCHTSFKPIALVVAKPNWECVVNKIRLLDAVIAACGDIGQSKPLIVEWDSVTKKFSPKSESEDQLGTDIEATDLVNKHTVILLSVTTPHARVHWPFSSDGWFGDLIGEFNSPSCSFILYQDYRGSRWPWSYIGYQEDHTEKAHSFEVDTIAAIPSVVMEILEKQSDT